MGNALFNDVGVVVDVDKLVEVDKYDGTGTGSYTTNVLVCVTTGRLVLLVSVYGVAVETAAYVCSTVLVHVLVVVSRLVFETVTVVADLVTVSGAEGAVTVAYIVSASVLLLGPATLTTWYVAAGCGAGRAEPLRAK